MTGKRAKITPQSLQIIIKRALEYPRRPRTEVAHDLQKHLKANGHEVPELEVLERKISYYRNNETASLLDQPWSISTLPKYEIAPQSLPVVLKLFVERLRSDSVHITIREALWIGRLAFIFKDEELLWQSAIEHSFSEKILEDLGFNLTDMGDDALLYGEMVGKDLTPADFLDIRKKESAAQLVRKRMETSGRKNKTKKSTPPTEAKQ